MESVCSCRPGRGYACHVRLDSRRRAPGHAPEIRRSIWSDLLYFPGPAAGHMYILELLCLVPVLLYFSQRDLERRR